MLYDLVEPLLSWELFCSPKVSCIVTSDDKTCALIKAATDDSWVQVPAATTSCIEGSVDVDDVQGPLEMSGLVVHRRRIVLLGSQKS